MQKHLWKEKLWFIIPFLFWLLIGAIILSQINKGDMVLFFNANRIDWANIFFSIGSMLAEYGFILFVMAVLLNQKMGYFFIYGITWAVSGVVAQSLKRVFDMPRPAGVFDERILHFVGKGKLHHHFSFPSGHTTTAFALFFALALFSKNKIGQFIFFLLAVSTAISRVYLLQHFYIDVYFGSILGVIIAYVLFVTINSSNIFGFQNWKNKKIGTKSIF